MLKPVVSAAIAAVCLVLVLAAPADAWTLNFLGLSASGQRSTSAELVAVPPATVAPGQFGFLTGGCGCCGGTAAVGWTVQPTLAHVVPTFAAAAVSPPAPVMAAVPVQAGGCCGGGAVLPFGMAGYSFATQEITGCQQRTAALLGAMDAPALGVPVESQAMSPAELTHHLATLTRNVEALTKTVQRHDAALRAPGPKAGSEE